MGIKKKLGLGLASAALGLSLVGGGTYAYFSDTAATNSTFAAGTLDLNADPTTIIDVNNIKPGDWMTRTFKLENNGSLDIAKVLLSTKYSIEDAKNDNNDDFGKHIRVNFLYNKDKALLGRVSPDQVVYRTTLAELKNMTPDAVSNAVFVPRLEEIGGLKAETSDELVVQFEFLDQGDQNRFQGDKLRLQWTFEGKQGAGVEKK